MLKKTASVIGQLLAFDSALYVRTPTDARLLALAETVNATNLTSNVDEKLPRLSFVFSPAKPSPSIQGQPLDAWAFPAIELMTDPTTGMLRQEYFKFLRRKVDNSVVDPASAFGLKPLEVKLNNFNVATGQPDTTLGNVTLEVLLGVYDLTTLAPVQLENSRNYDVVRQPELLFEWYNS